MSSLPDVKMLQAMAAVVLRAAQKVADPPMQLPHDTFLGSLDLRPAGVNYYRGTSRKGAEPLITGANPNIGLDMMDTYRQQILRAFFLSNTSNTRPRGRTPPSAEQVIDERTERLQAMAPIIVRGQREFAAPLVNRSYGVLDRQGLLPPVPAELDGIPLDIDFVSPAVLAQRLIEAENMERWVQAFSPIAAAKPRALDRINEDQFIERTHYIFDVSPDVLLTQEQADDFRKAEAEQEQRIAEAEIAQTQAGAAKDGAQAAQIISETGEGIV
jgi:hypothetical protein